MELTNTENRFPPGTFTAAPMPAAPLRMVTAQIKLEFAVFIRHGEQFLITMLIPIVMLVGLAKTGIGDLGQPRIDAIIAAVMMVSIMSTAFTSQAISVAFDRRYGALKRLGATPLPRWGIIAGKSGAVLTMVMLQGLVMGSIAFVLGWRPSILALLLGAICIAVGTLAFASLGLLLGGTLAAEIVLPLANLIWFILVGLGSLSFLSTNQHAWSYIVREIPSAALGHALRMAERGVLDWFSLTILAIWALIGTVAAVKWFTFD